MLALHYGRAKMPLAWVVPAAYPGMFRIKWPDGSLSDMVNLSRAKDAARVLAMRQVPSGNSKPLHWMQDKVQSVPEAAPVRLSA